MAFDPDMTIRFDWKSPGRDFLPLLQLDYPALEFLFSPAFEALANELAYEPPEACFPLIARHVQPFGYQLWHVDTGGDNHELALVPATDGAAFQQHWADIEWTTLQLVAPAPPAGKAAKKARKPDWLGDQHEFDGSTCITSFNYAGGYATEVERDEETRVRSLFLIDCNVWPPAELDMDELRADVDTNEVTFVGIDGTVKYWKRIVRRGEGDGDGGDVFQYERSFGTRFEDFGPPLTGHFHDTDAIVSGGAIYHPLGAAEGEGRFRTEIVRITQDAVQTIFTAPEVLAICALDGSRLLISRKVQYRSEELVWYRIWDERDAQSIERARMLPAVPVDFADACGFLGGDEILFCSRVPDPAPAHPSYPEVTLQLHRFDLATGEHAAGLMEGFGTTLKVNARMLATLPKQTIVMQSFEGNVTITPGADGWWAINYRTQMMGKKTVAWLWNRHTEALLKIEGSDLAGYDCLEILYSPGLQRYLAFAPYLAARLPALEAMADFKGPAFLRLGGSSGTGT